MSDVSSLFQLYKGYRIAVYGLSVETEKVLPELDKMFHVIGLLDGYREDGTLYGKPIISMEEAIREQVKLILVVARPGSCRVIAKRIGELCVKNRIILMDVRGKDLCSIQEAVYDLNHVQGITRSQLLDRVKEVDVVSFDLFDTLVMRQVLFSSDVYLLVDVGLRKRGICIEDFCGKRMESEKFLSQMKAPTLTEIYTYMTKIHKIREITPEQLAQTEWEVDLTLLVPRREMCEFAEKISDLGKDVYIVSDTYYTRQQVRQILIKCGVYAYKDILSSCEYQTGKTQQLFVRLQDLLLGRKCLHIGDDSIADVEYAQKNGIQSCQILSGIEFMERAGYLGLWDQLEGLHDRVKMGMFTAKLFNSPFQFEISDRKLCVKNSDDIGYLFFAPMLTDFVLWFDKQVEEAQIQNVWFGARDGYLVKRLYDELTETASSVYFLISRTVAIRSGMENEEDIAYVGEMKFGGSLSEQLKQRFGLQMSVKEGNTLFDYAKEILESSKAERENYKTYVDGLEIKEGNIAFFDFVAKGTSQMFLSRLVPRHIKGYYFLQLEEKYMREKKLDILPFYGQTEQEGSAIFEDYYILEVMLTSPMPSVEGFDAEGKPCYAKETRSAEDLWCIQKIQEGIFQYFKTYMEICGSFETQINQKIDEVFLRLIHKILICDEVFLNLKVEDPFFNRMTDMKELV